MKIEWDKVQSKLDSNDNIVEVSWYETATITRKVWIEVDQDDFQLLCDKISDDNNPVSLQKAADIVAHIGFEELQDNYDHLMSISFNNKDRDLRVEDVELLI